MEDQAVEEPDVTPLININLVILVMVLAIASHAARLLPLLVPQAKQTTTVNAGEALRLNVSRDRTFSLGDRGGLNGEELAGALRELEDSQIVLVDADPGVKYGALIAAIDEVMAFPELRVAFGGLGVSTAGRAPEGER